MGRRNQHSREQQRDMAIAAAELILVREGFGGLSMRKVADAIGYTVGQLYLIFENQDDLLAIINERTTDAIYGHLRDRAETIVEPLARLRALAAAYIEFAQRHPHRFRMLFEHQLPPAMQPRPSSELRIKRMFELVESTLAPLLPRTSPARLRQTAATLWSGVHGIAALAVGGKLKWAGDADFQRYSDQLVSTFVAGLAHV
ncbi:TetR/AcrR family transcriptional regulator [Sinimarinibacterium thermocellulolyticum]|uniref:TetR/AcrR family transcriptional regulator n=1 Tax=Sinimarinibacterium thermocellulolyticum TaxID=3170016 RepID=A0ABV2A9K6_9GAMM